MKKIKLIGLSYQRESILNALHKTGSVELSFAKNFEEDEKQKFDNVAIDVIKQKSERIKKAIETIEKNVDKAKGTPYYPTENISGGNFFVSYNDFMAIGKREENIFSVIDKIESLEKKSINGSLEKIKLQSLNKSLLPFKGVTEKFNTFVDTKNTVVKLGTLKKDILSSAFDVLNGLTLTSLSVLTDGDNLAVLLISHADEAQTAIQSLSELGFSVCPFNYDMTASEKLAEIESEILKIEKTEQEISLKIIEFSRHIKDIKTLYDYYSFELEKLTASEKFDKTQTTFTLEGYMPFDKVDEVKSAIDNVSKAVFYEFSDPDKDDNPPTLLKNKSLTHQAEFITDMYSAPDYREMDPNRFVFIFFMLFMGVIMADIGYGLLMLTLGLVLAKKQPVDNGSKKLWNVIAIGGVSAIIFGIIFNSFFGFSLLPFTLMVSPIPSNGMDNLKLILVLCLFLGVIHISAGYICKAINSFKHGDVLGGIFDGLTWVVFFIGFTFGTFNLIMGTLMSQEFTTNINPTVKKVFDTMQTPGLIIALSMLAVTALTAGRNEKGFGKITKGFGSLYGLINLMSDILSYARLFGLMLSGMIIAQTFNDIAMGLMTNALGYVMGALVMVIGHGFNLAMGVLGAYIHDSRLQYIEFFGKFYTGEGQPFTPLGSKFDYIYLTK